MPAFPALSSIIHPTPIPSSLPSSHTGHHSTPSAHLPCFPLQSNSPTPALQLLPAEKTYWPPLHLHSFSLKSNIKWLSILQAGPAWPIIQIQSPLYFLLEMSTLPPQLLSPGMITQLLMYFFKVRFPIELLAPGRTSRCDHPTLVPAQDLTLSRDSISLFTG